MGTWQIPPEPLVRLGEMRHQPRQQLVVSAFVAGAGRLGHGRAYVGLFQPHVARGLAGFLLVVFWLLLGIAPGLAQNLTNCPELGPVKYFQPPNLDGGFDVWNSGPWVVADDFICTNTGPITDIHLWGSWLNNAVDTNASFWLGMYDDVPAVTNGPAYIPSHPGTNLIWQQWFGPGQYLQSFWNGDVGTVLDPGPPAVMGIESKAYYDVPLATSPWTVPTTGPIMFYRVHCPQPGN
jgi:hypothetical protein